MRRESDGLADAFGGEAGPRERCEWLLPRNCSLSPAQTARAYGLLCLMSLAIAGGFLWLGVWQVLCFTGIELALTGAAFLYYARHAADYEHIVLSPGSLLVESVCAGRVRRTQFDPYWTRVAVPAGSRELVGLESKGVRLAVGRFALDAQRRQFAEELQGKLLGSAAC